MGKVTSNLLREAIADAKAVREAAYTNARATLEEAFNSKIKGMLARSIQREMEGDEDDLALGDEEGEYGPVDVDVDVPEDVAAEDELSLEGEELDMFGDEDELEMEGEDLGLDFDDEEMAEGEDFEDDEVYEVRLREFIDGQVDRDAYTDIEDIGDGYASVQDDNGSDTDVIVGNEYDPEGPGAEKEPFEEGLDLDDLEDTDLEDPVMEMRRLRRENRRFRRSISEHRKVVKWLKGQLQEVNLFNTKLQYATKLVKRYGLNRQQYGRVVEALDRARDGRQLKRIAVRLSENLATRTRKAARRPVARRQTRRIAESFSSSTTGTTRPKQIVENGDKTVARLKKLAGIK